MTGPRVFVGPDARPELVDAVRAGGGEPSPLADAEAIVYYGTDDPRELRDLVHPGIRWVQLPHAGIEPWANAGLVTVDPVVTCASGSYGPAVAEHALALILAAARHLSEYARATSWGGNHTRELAGSTVGIVGAGGIGGALVRLLAPFGVRVEVVSESGRVEGADRVVPRADLTQVLAVAHYVVVAAPSTPQTRGMINATTLAAMRDDAWLVNVARGDLVVTDDLVAALRKSVIAGAALDVTAPEPLPEGHPLWMMPQVIITPHCANPRSSYWSGLAARVRTNVAVVAAAEQGAPLMGLEGVVRPGRGY